MTNKLIDEYESRQRERHIRVTNAAIDGKTVAEALISSGIHENVITSAERTPFTYEIQLPQVGQGRERPVLYISRNTKDFERNYESTERELACVVWAYNKLRHLLEGSETVLVTDHAPIREVL